MDSKNVVRADEPGDDAHRDAELQILDRAHMSEVP
jgi:hypothetical protein